MTLLGHRAMLLRFLWRSLSELSFKTQWKALTLYILKGLTAILAYKKRLKNDELYPPFMFIALTNQCNLRCKGCWVEKEGNARVLPEQDIDALIRNGKQAKAHYYTLLGGEPMMVPHIWNVFEKYNDCYFQVITNGMLFTEENVARLKKAGNVTPLISIDGFGENNDDRRGKGVFQAIEDGLDRLKKAKILYGVATTATSKNLEEVMSDAYVEHFINKGVMYIWYYVYRPVGEHSHSEYCLSKEQLIWFRQQLLRLRKRHPILVIDTYWTASGEAFCPAATGLGFHIGPEGSIEICPPLSFATEKVSDNDGNVYKTINESSYLRGFQNLVQEKTKGCVILEHPQELVTYMKDQGAVDYSTRDGFAEIDAIEARNSHHLPEDEIPEDFWFYRFMKKQVFFGMGANG